MEREFKSPVLGELKPSQIIYTFGIGSIIDFPNISAIVKGLDYWSKHNGPNIYQFFEPRLLKEINRRLRPSQIKRLLPLPINDEVNRGIPVKVFPGWVRCPLCARMTGVANSDIIQLKTDFFSPDKNRYVHVNCSKAKGNNSPNVYPVRRMLACKNGHLDDFPWKYFIHRGESGCNGPYYWKEGSTGEPEDIYLHCEGCSVKPRPLSDALGDKGKKNLPQKCTGYHPHLDYYEDCDEIPKVIVLGASNIWFPMSLSVISIPNTDPVKSDLDVLIDKMYNSLQGINQLSVVSAFRMGNLLGELDEYSDEEIWDALERKRSKSLKGTEEDEDDLIDLKSPEWELFSSNQSVDTKDFTMFNVNLSKFQSKYFSSIKRIERLKEVVSLIGFSRLISPGEFGDFDITPKELQSPLASKEGRVDWVPTIEVKGEGIFIQFREEFIKSWLSRESVLQLNEKYFTAYKNHQKTKGIQSDDPSIGYPGIRYVLLHSFSHAFMRQLSLECGYSLSSIKERIFSSDSKDKKKAMAGILIYTAAADSDGTLGGLANLANPDFLEKIIQDLIHDMSLCSSDPHCAEKEIEETGNRLYGASCHSCLFLPETSCEKGNKFLDRNVLVSTISGSSTSFFRE